MNRILLFLALLAFMVGGIISVVDDTPDVPTLFLALFVGLGLWVASLLAPA